MRLALATLPWVEQDSITADVGTHLATFGVKDKSKFNMEQVKEALKKQDFPEVELVSGPDAPAAAKDSPSDKGKPDPKGAAAPAKTEGAQSTASKTSGDSRSGKNTTVAPPKLGKIKSQP